VTRGDRLVVSNECYGTFYLIFKLSDVSWSVELRQKLHHIGIETVNLLMLPLRGLSQEMAGQNRNILSPLA
jgi:hypothetical protein